jgi:hypothetical protein
VDALSEKDGNVLVRLRVQPRASRESLSTGPEGQIRAAVKAPPTDGKANAAVCAIVAKALGLPKSAVKVLRGAASREKTLALKGIGLDAARQALKERVKP